MYSPSGRHISTSKLVLAIILGCDAELGTMVSGNPASSNGRATLNILNESRIRLGSAFAANHDRLDAALRTASCRGVDFSTQNRANIRLRPAPIARAMLSSAFTLCRRSATSPEAEW